MKKVLTIAMAGAGLLTGSAASAQMVDPALSRDLGRAVGQATVAAQRAAEEARIAAREAMRAARQGYAQGTVEAGAPLVTNEDAAVDACAMAAEQRGYDYGVRAVVRDIVDVDRTPYGWEVGGVVETRHSWRDARPETTGFRCSVRNGQVANVDLGQDFARR